MVKNGLEHPFLLKTGQNSLVKKYFLNMTKIMRQNPIFAQWLHLRLKFGTGKKNEAVCSFFCLKMVQNIHFCLKLAKIRLEQKYFFEIEKIVRYDPIPALWLQVRLEFGIGKKIEAVCTLFSLKMVQNAHFSQKRAKIRLVQKYSKEKWEKNIDKIQFLHSGSI